MCDSDAQLAAKRIACLEAEIEARRREIDQLQSGVGSSETYTDNVTGDGRDQLCSTQNEPASLQQSMKDLIVLWEQRLGKDQIGREIIPQHKKVPLLSALHDADADGPPAVIYTASMDSDETRDGPPSLVGIEDKSTETHLQVSLRMIEERDQKIERLEEVIHSDIEIIKKMKETMEKMVDMRVEAKANTPQEMFPGELDCILVALKEKHNVALEEQCADMQDELKGLEIQCSNQENLIEYLKTEMVNLLVSKQMVEKELDSELEQHDRVVAILKSSFKQKEDQFEQLTKELGSRNSSLEDEIEILKAENVRLRVRSQILEEEKNITERAMQTEMQLFYIENKRHEIL